MDHSSLRRAAQLAALVSTIACQETAAPSAPLPSLPDSPLYARGGGPPKTAVPDGKGIGTRTYSPGPRTKYRLEYHDGVIRLGSVRVYFIFYGSWPETDRTPGILTDFAASLNGSSYYQINTLYPEATGTGPSNAVLWARNATDAYSRGATLNDADVDSIVVTAIRTGLLPHDTNGAYFVVGSPDVTVTSGLGVTYCAFHNRTTYQGTITYAFIGHAARNPAACAPQLAGPNGDYAADAMVSLVAAELSNMVTDPMFTGYYDRIGLSPADKCAWDFGPTYQAPNGALANLHIGGRHYLVQKLWVPTRNGGYCAMAAP